MKTTIKKTTKLFLMLIIALTFSCSAEDGAIGPAGANGADGIDGIDGNANVTSVLFESFVLVIGDNNFAVPELTQEIYDTGFVYSYARNPAASVWEEIPISNNGSIQLETVISVGNVKLKSTFNQTADIRFVLVASN
ncbi:hypothetical protein [Aureibaculum luteum]|uniref:hypothetical protein n=1 Tax=Aureibaculum luteum TaxID=1548456 RepID=UPI000E4A9438|nr:hypothetical protein [Aureibaculum luteum]